MIDQEIFENKKKNLIQLIKEAAKTPGVSLQYKEDLETVLKILNEYSFENRLQQKGLLTHTLVDSLSLYDALGEKILEFDKSIK
jgi:hypothetical protein